LSQEANALRDWQQRNASAAVAVGASTDGSCADGT
jgi:hypothetical protein